MATPKGALHRDLEQRFKNVEGEVRALKAALLTRRQLSVTEGDFVVSGGGGIIVKDSGFIQVMFPESLAGDPNTPATTIGDLYAGGTYVGTGSLVSDIEGNAVFLAFPGADGLVSSAEVEVGRSTGPARRFRVYAVEDFRLSTTVGGAVLYGHTGMNINTGPGGQTQLGLGSSAVYIGHSTTGSAANARLETNGQLSRVTSSRRYKDAIEPAGIDPAAVLQIEGRTWVDKTDRGEDEPRRQVGFIAEELHDAGLTEFVDYDDQGRPDAIQYDRLSVALLAVAKDQQTQLDALAARLEALEAKA